MNDQQKYTAMLNAALAERGWSQSELARRAGLRRAAISTYCKGVAMPSKAFRDSIDKVLSVPPDQSSSDAPRVFHDARKPGPAPVIELSRSASGAMHLRLDLVVSLEQAMKILALLKADA